MKSLFAFLALMSIFFALPVLAQAPLENEEVKGSASKNGCLDYHFPVCANGLDCLDAFGNPLYVVNPGGRMSVVIQEGFNDRTIGSTTYTASTRTGAQQCEVRWSFTGHDADAADYSVLKDYSTGNPIYITDSEPSLIFTGNLPLFWIHCDTVAAGVSTFWTRVCPIN